MQIPNTKRLLKLYDWSKENLNDDNFYFGAYVESFDYQNHCGTVCCLLVWMPKVEPNDWYWTEDNHVLLKGHTSEESSAEEWFNIDTETMYAIFQPNNQYFLNYVNLTELNCDSKLEDVLANLNKIIIYWEKQKEPNNGNYQKESRL